MQPIDHSQPGHDDTLVARLAADDLDGPEAAAARTLVAECPACATLLADLRAIIQATATLPAPRRPRDFRLTEADAARLRPAGWRAILRAFGQPRMSVAGPLATGLAALGIGGLLVATLSGGLAGAAAGTAASLPSGAAERAAAPSGAAYASTPDQQPQPLAATQSTAGPASADALTPSAPPVAALAPVPSAALSAAPSLAAGLNPKGVLPSPGAAAASSGPGPLASQLADGGGELSAASPEPLRFGAADSTVLSLSSGPSPLIVGSVVLLLVGLGLGLLRLVGRRLA